MLNKIVSNYSATPKKIDSFTSITEDRFSEKSPRNSVSTNLRTLYNVGRAILLIKPRSG